MLETSMYAPFSSLYHGDAVIRITRGLLQAVDL